MIRQWATYFMMSMVVTTSVFAANAPLKGAKETLACRLGTEDRHARIAVVLIGGKTSEFAYYTKWKPRTCSIYLQRNRDSYSKWADTGAMTTVNLEKGVVLIEHKKGVYTFEFRDIDRERYCGMDGRINGTLTIRKGHDECELAGIMDEGTPLGQANRNREEEDTQTAGAALLQSTSRAQPATVSVVAPVRESAVAAPQPATVSVAPPARESAIAAPRAADAAGPPSFAPAVSAAAEVTPQVTPSPPPAATQEKAAETGSWNPFRAIFRALTTPRGPDASSSPSAPGQ